jgi:hypothetical protein
MWLLALKLTITPAVIAAATVAARRFGPAVGGWLVGLPLTCAPVVLFVALERGPGFAAHVSSGAVGGVTAEAAFVLGYVAVALRGRGWLPSLAAGTVAFIAAGVVVDQAHPPLSVLLLSAVVSLLVGLRLVPRTPRIVWPQRRWELPLRIVLTTSLALLVTGFAGALGPGVSGVATTYPLITSTLAISLHRTVGADAAIAVYRGLLLGVFALTAFAATAVLALTRLPLTGALLVALLIAVVAQLGSLPAARRAHAT